MAAPRNRSLILLLSLGAWLTAGLARAEYTLSQVRLDNAVSKCMQLTPKAIEHSGTIIKLLANARFTRNTGECGCKSALLRYTVSAQTPAGHRVEWMSGAITTLGTARQAKTFEFVLSGDASIPQSNQLTLSIMCAAPP